MNFSSVCTISKHLQICPIALSSIPHLGNLNQCKRRTSIQPSQLGIWVRERKSISHLKPHYYRYSPHCSLSAELAPVASAAYGVLLLGGGLFAYTRTQSKGSLLGGLTGAGLMGTAYFLMQAPETKNLGEALAFGSALLFASVFGIRLAATRKIIPAGPLLALSICALALFLSAYLQETV